MRHKKLQAVGAAQHGIITRAQLLSIGFSTDSITYQIKRAQLFSVHRGVYAIGRPQLTPHGYWLAAVLSCGPHAVLSHECAGNLWKLTTLEPKTINVSTPSHVNRKRPGISLHRRGELIFGGHVTRHQGIPATTPAATLVDLATILSSKQLDAAINEADKRGLINQNQLLNILNKFAGQPGVMLLRDKLEKATLVLTDSELERIFMRLVKSSGLPLPKTGVYVNEFKVDFFWPDIGLVVETDGLRYHRTPLQQSKDRLRDQIHTSRGFTTLRFTHAQIVHMWEYVSEILGTTILRLHDART